ncbi:hypothetical protein [Burkholderia dolosa]|uniref:hypothetical protein n=1 Tax=Burkholderia dolosa TaxID=152500 RepID=UPI001C95588E|nr:hypothetical protein [Burkholderia dolosa]MBY4832762.1 hypothetical protein [Burkholderia dolosa]
MMFPESATGPPTNAGTAGELGVSIRNGPMRVRGGRVTTCKVCCRVTRRLRRACRYQSWWRARWPDRGVVGVHAAAFSSSGVTRRARAEVLEVAEVAEVLEVREAFRRTPRMPPRTRPAHRQIECAASRHLIGVARRRRDIVTAFSINGRAALQFAR